MRWTIELRGGSYDGYGARINEVPQPLIIVWYCGGCSHRCEGHASFDVADPAIILSRAQAYTLTEADEATRLAVYEVGDVVPQAEDELDECVLAGASMARIADSDHLSRGPMPGVLLGALLGVVMWTALAVPVVLS